MRSVAHEQIYSCGVACVTSITQNKYKQAL